MSSLNPAPVHLSTLAFSPSVAVPGHQHVQLILKTKTCKSLTSQSSVTAPPRAPRSSFRVPLSASFHPFPEYGHDEPHPSNPFSDHPFESSQMHMSYTSPSSHSSSSYPSSNNTSPLNRSVRPTAPFVSHVLPPDAATAVRASIANAGYPHPQSPAQPVPVNTNDDHPRTTNGYSQSVQTASNNHHYASDASNTDTDELYFNGLSYPVEVLDWCSTNGSELVDDYHSYARASPSTSSDSSFGRLCVTDSTIPLRVERSFVDTFRMSSPYINAHQGLVFVIHIPGELLHEPLFPTIMEDIALMRVVGVKLVLVLGPQTLISERLQTLQIPSHLVNGIRITDAQTLRVVKELAGSMRFEVECALSKGVTNMPSTSRISVVSGNFFSAQPVGIINGHDFGFTGKVRRIDVDAIQKRLGDGDILLLSNVGGSPSGQQFNCRAEEVAAECAAALKAEKLIFMGSGETLYDRRNDHSIPNLSLKTAAKFLRLRAQELPSEFCLSLQCSISALERGVRRAHILNRHMNGVLLMEVFHRDGVGLMISKDLYEGFRPAKIKDVNGVKEIIRPLEEQGILKSRSRTKLERDIEKFVVIERDGMIIACLSLSIMEDDPTWAEMGCVAVHKDYRKLGKGDAMLGFTERMAYDKGVRNLFILSTQSFDWFHERGFKEVRITDLPQSRQKKYDQSRRSKIFHKVLQGSRAVSHTNSFFVFVFVFYAEYVVQV